MVCSNMAKLDRTTQDFQIWYFSSQSDDTASPAKMQRGRVALSAYALKSRHPSLSRIPVWNQHAEELPAPHKRSLTHAQDFGFGRARPRGSLGSGISLSHNGGVGIFALGHDAVASRKLIERFPACVSENYHSRKCLSIIAKSINIFV